MRKVRSKVLEDILKKTNLETRLKVTNEMIFISLLSDLGYRKDMAWSDADQYILNKLLKIAKSHTENQLLQIKEWEDDGRPE